MRQEVVIRESIPLEGARYVGWAWKDTPDAAIRWCCRNPTCVLEMRLTKAHTQKVMRVRAGWTDKLDRCAVCKAEINWPAHEHELLP